MGDQNARAKPPLLPRLRVLLESFSVGPNGRDPEVDVHEHDLLTVGRPLWCIRPAVVDDRVRAAEQVGCAEHKGVFVGNLAACRIPAVAPEIGPLVAIERERYRHRARLRDQSGDVAIRAKLERRRLSDSTLGDEAARPAARLDRDLLAAGHPLQREGWVARGIRSLKGDVVRQLDPCRAVVVVVLVVVVAVGEDFDLEASVRIGPVELRLASRR